MELAIRSVCVPEGLVVLRAVCRAEQPLELPYP